MINNEFENERHSIMEKLTIFFKKNPFISLVFIYIFLFLLFIPRNKINDNKKINNFKTNKCIHNYHKIKQKDPDEKSEGIIFHICGFCGYQYNQSIPILNEDNYIVERLVANCQHGNGKRYISKKNKSIYYDKTDSVRLPHSAYGNKCSICHQNIGEFNFQRLSDVFCEGYPRLYQLSDYWNNTWLLGGDNGTILCRISQDKGHSWTNPVNVSNLSDYFCSNVDFFELPNHEIICSYRAIGIHPNNPEINYNRKIFSSISKDGGRSWENLGLVVDNFILSEQLGKTKEDAIEAFIRYKVPLGFYEPFVSYINNKITLIYADDFTPTLLEIMGEKNINNIRVQSIYSVTFDLKTKMWSKNRTMLMNGYIKKSPTNSGLMKRPSRDGMPVIDIMKDGTYVMVFEGTYRDSNYTYFTGDKLEEFHPFEIVISYSKDGEIWSNPTEVFVPKNNGSKASAPFICITDTNQLIISFQTDEDSVTSGYIGDSYSIMKVIISKPGIKIEDINKDSFYAIINNYKTPIGGRSVWNGMMLIENTIYTVSSGYNILFSQIPLYANSSEYNLLFQNEFSVINGSAEFKGNKIIVQKNNTLIVNKIIDISINNTFYSYVIPNSSGYCGLIFGINDSYQHNKKKINYYSFLIKKNGYLSMEKNIGNERNELSIIKELSIKDFNKNNEYKMAVKFNISSGEIMFGINDSIQLVLYDSQLKGNRVGFISEGKGTIFNNFVY